MYWRLALLLCVVLSHPIRAESPVAETKLGTYRGYFIRTLNGREVAAFNGIRYAKPPVNNLRFEDPEKIESHEGEYDATKDGDDCLQEKRDYNQYLEAETSDLNYVGQEDCLFLNVYTPNLKPEKQYPVIVYIHGGSFLQGTSASNYHGPQLLLDKDVVLVTINYRLGIFGFLSIDDEIVPGNMGLKDQSLAIHWVKDNIGSFGGDSGSITLMGHSAGAAAVHFNMISPLNKGIIQKAISQSGSGGNFWSTTSKKQSRDFISELAAGLNCPLLPTPLLACLKQKTWKQILTFVSTYLKNKPHTIVHLGPVFETKDGGFMTENDYNKGSTIPWLTGVNNDEGLLYYKEIHKVGRDAWKNFNDKFKEILPVLFNYDMYPETEKISNQIKRKYFGEQEICDKTGKQLINMISDGAIFHGQLQSARKHKGNTYFYLITHAGENSLASGLPISGVCHADELFYLFPFSKTPSDFKFNEDDAKMQKLMLDLWTNFTIYGNPTPDKSEPQWYESEKGQVYVIISPSGIQLAKNFYSTRMNFWDEIRTTLLSFNPLDSRKIKDEL